MTDQDLILQIQTAMSLLSDVNRELHRRQIKVDVSTFTLIKTGVSKIALYHEVADPFLMQ